MIEIRTGKFLAMDIPGRGPESGKTEAGNWSGFKVDHKMERNGWDAGIARGWHLENEFRNLFISNGTHR